MASLALASRADYSHLRAASRDGDVHFIRSFLRERDPYDLTACVPIGSLSSAPCGAMTAFDKFC